MKLFSPATVRRQLREIRGALRWAKTAAEDALRAAEETAAHDIVKLRRRCPHANVAQGRCVDCEAEGCGEPRREELEPSGETPPKENKEPEHGVQD